MWYPYDICTFKHNGHLKKINYGVTRVSCYR